MITTNRFLATLTLIVASLATDSRAQDDPVLGAGSRVRITVTKAEADVPGVGLIRGGQIFLAPGVTIRRYRMDGPRPTMVELDLPGEAIRMIPLNGTRLEGGLVSVDETTITIRSGNEDLVVPRAAVARMEWAARPKNRWAGAGKGLAIAGGLGLGVGLLMGNDPKDDWFSMTAGEKGLLLGILAMPVGGLIGAVAGGGRRWQPIEPGEVKLAVQAVPKGAAVAIRFGFAGRTGER